MIDSDFAAGWQFHQEGRYADAARCYQALLVREPNHADALHLFGVLHYQNGYVARAAELIEQAAALRPEAAAFHANLAEAYRALGRQQEAIDCCRTALRLQPEYPEAANNLGLALHALGHYAEAAEQFRCAVRMRADFAVAQNNLGTSLRELERWGEALEAFRAAVALDPSLAPARSNLGQLLVDAGQPEEALAHCREAVRLQPKLPAAHNNLGNVYRALERWPEAHAAFDEALRLAPDLAKIHINRGLTFCLEGKPSSAVPSFRCAAEIAPDDAEAWQSLAIAHIGDDDYATALACWERFVALKPEEAQGYNDLGWAHQVEGQLAQAAACYRRALELQPGHVEAQLNQGRLHEELGELAEAEAWYRRAQSDNPLEPAPLACLATLLRGQLPDADREAIRVQLARFGPLAHAPLFFGMAQVLDAQGSYAEAAAYLARANDLSLEHSRKMGRLYDPVEHSGFVDRLIAGFTPDLFSRLAGAGDDTCLPIFIFGLPRSGTTLVEQILASHSRVHGAGELRLARRTFESIPAVLSREDDMRTCLGALDAAAVRTLGRHHRESLEAILQRDGAAIAPERIVDKMPDNYLYLGLLAVLFPRATFLHVRRDLRDVAVSCWMTNFRTIRWTNNPEHLAQRMRDYLRVTAHWENVLPVKMHDVVYERLVDNFEFEARRLVAACGLHWEPACLNFHNTKRPVRTASVTQVRQPVYRRALARWKNYETALAELFARLPNDVSNHL